MNVDFFRSLHDDPESEEPGLESGFFSLYASWIEPGLKLWIYARSEVAEVFDVCMIDGAVQVTTDVETFTAARNSVWWAEEME